MLYYSSLILTSCAHGQFPFLCRVRKSKDCFITQDRNEHFEGWWGHFSRDPAIPLVAMFVNFEFIFEFILSMADEVTKGNIVWSLQTSLLTLASSVPKKAEFGDIQILVQVDKQLKIVFWWYKICLSTAYIRTMFILLIRQSELFLYNQTNTCDAWYITHTHAWITLLQSIIVIRKRGIMWKSNSQYSNVPIWRHGAFIRHIPFIRTNAFSKK